MSKIIAGAKAAIARLTRQWDANFVFRFSGGKLSDPVFIGDFAGVGFKTGAAGWNTGDVTWLVGMSENDLTWGTLKDNDGNAITSTSVTNNDARAVADVFPFPYVRLQSSVDQTIDVAGCKKG